MQLLAGFRESSGISLTSAYWLLASSISTRSLFIGTLPSWNSKGVIDDTEVGSYCLTRNIMQYWKSLRSHSRRLTVLDYATARLLLSLRYFQNISGIPQLFEFLSYCLFTCFTTLQKCLRTVSASLRLGSTSSRFWRCRAASPHLSKKGNGFICPKGCQPCLEKTALVHSCCYSLKFNCLRF